MANKWINIFEMKKKDNKDMTTLLKGMKEKKKCCRLDLNQYLLELQSSASTVGLLQLLII